MSVQQAHEANAMLQKEVLRVKDFCAHTCSRLLSPGTQDTEMLRAARGGSWENLKSFYADWLRSGCQVVVQSYGEEARAGVAKSQGSGVPDLKEVKSGTSRKRSPGRRGGGVRDVSVKNRAQGHGVYSEDANWTHHWGGVGAEMRHDKDDVGTNHHANAQKGVSAGTVRV